MGEAGGAGGGGASGRLWPESTIAVTAMRDEPEILCWRCGARLTVGPPGAGARCRHGHVTPLVAGIVDCRPALPGFDVESDRRLALELDAIADEVGFEELLRRYWSAVPQVDDRLTERYVRGDLIGAARAEEVCRQVGDAVGRPVTATTAVLEIGCGTAALGSALSRLAGRVVATDVSLAWLVLARRRLDDVGRTNVRLVAATADRLPFPSEAFDLVVGADVIEHVPDVEAAITSCYRVLRPGGTLWLATPNRYSLTPEPHVRLWGVGLLPRRLGLRYVRRFRGVDYGEIRTLSAGQLRRSLASTGGSVTVDVPRIAAAVRSTYGAPARWAIDAFHLARRLPLVRRALLTVAPLLHATVTKAGAFPATPTVNGPR